MSRRVSGVEAGRGEGRLAAQSPTGRRGGRRLAEERDVMQTRTFANSGGDKELSCGKIQQNAIKDKFFIVLSCRQLGKIPLPQHK